jgi:thiol-disulfide isomerase/thioredoxin
MVSTKHIQVIINQIICANSKGCVDINSSNLKATVIEGGEKLILFLLIAFGVPCLNAQTITGSLSSYAGQPLKLEGFNGLKTYSISSTTIDEMGSFTLTYAKEDPGVGYLMVTDGKPLFVILSGEDVEIVGESFGDIETLNITKGKENLWFEQYAREHPKREQALSAWLYLEKMYGPDPLFGKHKASLKAIRKEKERIRQEDEAFVQALPKGSYVRWFLPMRRLVSSVSVVAQFRPEKIPATRQALRSIDYSDPRLYRSGLFRDALDNHIWFLENSSGPLDSVFTDINRSLDIILGQLEGNEELFNEVTDHLFKLLEKRSLFRSAEYLALKVLNEAGCAVNQSLTAQLESYRKMKKGSLAPDIVFTENTRHTEDGVLASLYAMPGRYKLVVFMAGWCEHCRQELPELVQLWPQWRAQGLSAVLVSLDESREAFEEFTAPVPFTVTTDLGKWESQPVKDYHVFGTPTYYLLDSDHRIVLRPASLSHLQAWADYTLGTER